jgi:hypothetical protein
VIVALWHRWQTGHGLHYLALALAVLALDIFLGSALLAWELRVLREVWP